MIEFKIVGLDKVTGLMNRLSPAKSRTVYQRALRKGGEVLKAYIKQEELSGQLLKNRSGYLRGSINVHDIEIGGLPAVSVRAGGGSKDVKYARIQEEGGTITPKRAKYLTIPLPSVLTPAGKIQDRYNPMGGSLRNFPSMQGAFVLKTDSGTLLLVASRNGGKDLEALFVLVKSVTIKAKHYMAIAAKVKKDDVSKIVVDAINSLAGKANANTRYNI